MDDFIKQLKALSDMIGGYLGQIPFPEVLQDLFEQIREQALAIHPLLPLGIALVLSVIAAQLTLWVMQLPLIFLWQIFGFLSGNNVNILSIYNLLAQLLAFLIALKIVFEMHPLEELPL